MAQQWLSIVEYARAFNISDMTIRRRIKTGKLVATLKDGKYFIPVDVDAISQNQDLASRPTRYNKYSKATPPNEFSHPETIKTENLRIDDSNKVDNSTQMNNISTDLKNRTPQSYQAIMPQLPVSTPSRSSDVLNQPPPSHDYQALRNINTPHPSNNHSPSFSPTDRPHQFQSAVNSQRDHPAVESSSISSSTKTAINYSPKVNKLNTNFIDFQSK